HAGGLPTLRGKWYSIGPFDSDGDSFDAAYPPEKGIDLKKTYPGKGGQTVAWKEFADFRVGAANDLRKYRRNENAAVYLYHQIEATEAVTLPVSLGSDDQLAVWLNGQEILRENVIRAVAPDQNRADLKLKAGKNQLLVKVGNVGGDWAFYVLPEFPPSWPAK